LFTGTTWEEFLKAGGNVSGFRESRKKICQQIKPGDYLLCYCTGISRWIGLLEVAGSVYYDSKTQIWSQDSFPWRFPVKVLIALKPEHAVPVLSLRERLSYFQNLKAPHAWTGHFRGSPAREKPEDARIIIEALEKARDNPKEIPFDEKKYKKIPQTIKKYKTKAGTVTIPEEEEEVEEGAGVDIHREIQWMLIRLGKELGLDVSVARTDRNREYAGKKFGDFCLDEIPLHFDEATNRTIENIDVIWLKDKSIEAAFEVEHTTSIYSGILRMSDLISMQPNINIKLYIVAPEERREKVYKEIMRPTFAKLNPPLSHCCQYISYAVLKKKVKEVSGVIQHLKPSFIDELAESCIEDDD
jgi:predicted RNA-binding protein